MKLGKFCLLLNKRLYRKPLFLVLILLIPLLTFGYSTIARADSGIMTVALAQNGAEEPLYQHITQELINGSEMIRYILCETPEEANEMVTYGKADSAWIFESDLQNKICKFVQKPVVKNAFIQVLEREESVALLLTHEKLSGTIFTCLSPEIYLQYIRKNVPELSEFSDETLLRHYEEVSMSDTLFTFAAQKEASPAQNYLLTPMRGLLAIVTMLCGLASAMFYTEDTKQGLFSRIPLKHLPVTEFLCQTITVGNIALIATVALFLAGLATNPLTELILLLVYIPCVSLFAMVLRRACRSMQALGILTPLLIVVTLCVCPIFLDLAPLRTLALLFPPTYFIRGAFDAAFIGYMALHCGICAAICFIFDRLFRKA